MGKVSADIVTVSHPSRNHAFVEGVSGRAQVVNGPGEYEVADILIAGVATALEPGKGPKNTAYVFRFDDATVCHLGDLASKLTNAEVEEIGNIDLLLLPVGGGSALDATAAAEVVAQLEPGLVVPMHYRSGEALPDGEEQVSRLDTAEAFCREMGSTELSPEPKLTVTKSSGPQELAIVLLETKRVQG